MATLTTGTHTTFSYCDTHTSPLSTLTHAHNVKYYTEKLPHVRYPMMYPMLLRLSVWGQLFGSWSIHGHEQTQSEVKIKQMLAYYAHSTKNLPYGWHLCVCVLSWGDSMPVGTKTWIERIKYRHQQHIHEFSELTYISGSNSAATAAVAIARVTATIARRFFCRVIKHANVTCS